MKGIQRKSEKKDQQISWKSQTCFAGFFCLGGLKKGGKPWVRKGACHALRVWRCRTFWVSTRATKRCHAEVQSMTTKNILFLISRNPRQLDNSPLGVGLESGYEKNGSVPRTKSVLHLLLLGVHCPYP